jgi:hypothetical protein
MSLDRFFSRYAQLSTGPRPEDLAPLYAPTFIVGGPEGSQAFANDARFIEWLQQVTTFNRKRGMQALTVVSIRDISLSPLHTLASVTWGARFEATGDRLVEFEISYLLEVSADAWRILAYISRADQQREMERAGLLTAG